MLSLQQLAAALGGEVTGHKVLCPGPGHSANEPPVAKSASEGVTRGDR
jgi:hypothetical protein